MTRQERILDIFEKENYFTINKYITIYGLDNVNEFYTNQYEWLLELDLMQPARVHVLDEFNGIDNVLLWERGIIREGIIPKFKEIGINFVFINGTIHDIEWYDGYIFTRNSRVNGGYFYNANVGKDVIWNKGVFIEGSFNGKWYGGIFKHNVFNGEWYKGDFKADKKGKRIFEGRFYKGTFGDVDESIFTIFNERVARWYGGNWAGGYDSKGKWHETFDDPTKW